jgi:hypothetical protein
MPTYKNCDTICLGAAITERLDSIGEVIHRYTMRARYVVFNGSQEQPLKEDRWYDHILTADMKDLSVSSVWVSARNAGYDSVLLLACAAGETAKELRIEGKIHGAFSYFATKLLREHPTHRELITRVNHQFRSIGLDQQCEVICRRGLLDRPCLSSDFTVIVDACRSRSSTSKYKVDHAAFVETTILQRQSRRMKRLFGKSDQKVFTFSGHGRQLFDPQA